MNEQCINLRDTQLHMIYDTLYEAGNLIVGDNLLPWYLYITVPTAYDVIKGGC